MIFSPSGSKIRSNDIRGIEKIKRKLLTMTALVETFVKRYYAVRHTIFGDGKMAFMPQNMHQQGDTALAAACSRTALHKKGQL